MSNSSETGGSTPPGATATGDTGAEPDPARHSQARPASAENRARPGDEIRDEDEARDGEIGGAGSPSAPGPASPDQPGAPARQITRRPGITPRRYVPQPKRVRLRRTRRALRHPVTRGVLGVLVILIGWLAWSVGGALTRPGKDSVAARLAEWARDHHLNPVVNRLEKIQYDMNKPKTGGDVANIPTAVKDTPSVVPSPQVTATVPPHSPAPPPVATPPGLAPKPGEGQWQPVVYSGDLPAVRLTYVRPDDQHTSYLAALMWLDPKLLTATLHPGVQDPGGTWRVPSSISPQERAKVAAAFPGGFRLTGSTGSRGGWYTEGRDVTPLRDGAASLVIYKNGSVRIGQWGRDVNASPYVESVRQNLDLLIDHGRLDPSCSDNNSPKWGWTLGNAAFVPRTAIGQRADGSLVFVNSPATSVCSIGHLLQAAGVVRGMELDINPEWSIGFYYTHEGGQVVGHPTRLDQGKGGDWYFSTQSRDFLSFSLR